MTEEEKKAIETMQSLINGEYGSVAVCDKRYIKIVLNLIEKQQKELENSVPKEAIKEKIEDIEDYFDRLNVPDEDIKFIIEKRKEILGE